MPNATPSEFLTARICFWLSALIILGSTLLWEWRTQYPFYSRIIVGCLVGVLFFTIFPLSMQWLNTRQSQPRDLASSKLTPAPTPSSETTSAVKRVTIHDLFLTDFPLLSSNGRAEVATSTDAKAELTIEFRTWYDLKSNAKFVSIWVPFSPATFEVLKAVAEQYNDILRARIQSITAPANPADKTRMILAMKDGAFIDITFKTPGDSSIVKPLDFPSTSKVYLYYEYDLSLSQLGALENLFQSKGLSPQFRNWDYTEGKPTPNVEDVIARTVEFKLDNQNTGTESNKNPQ